MRLRWVKVASVVVICVPLTLSVSVHPALAGDSAGFFWGADGNAPSPNEDSGNPCKSSSRPYLEPWVTDPSGGCGKFGVDYGEIFAYWNIPGFASCGTGDAYNGTAIADAAANENGYGVGPGGYYFAAGPGVDPHYDGSTNEAYNWGVTQGQYAVNNWSSHPDISSAGLPIVIDIEEGGTQGWADINKGCSGVTGGRPSTAVDRATINGIWGYINNGYYPAIYSTTGNWSTIFNGSSDGNFTDTMQWTADWGSYGTGCAQYGPLVWTQTYLDCGGQTSNSAAFFGGIDSGSNCTMAWQWASPDNRQKDYDQLDANHLYICH
jgi:hypothetical protein